MFTMQAWFHRGIGRWAKLEEQRLCRRTIRDVLGLYCAQLGGEDNPLLSLSPIRHCFYINYKKGSIIADWRELPFPTDTLDLLVLPHTLEITANPHAVLREAVRVLRPEGRLIIIGFNPYSLFGLSPRIPWRRHWLSIMRIKDWLRLLDMEIIGGAYGAYLPPWQWGRWQKLHWLEHAGRRWWPIGGGLFLLHAVKRRHNMRLIMTPPFSKTLKKDLVGIGAKSG